MRCIKILPVITHILVNISGRCSFLIIVANVDRQQLLRPESVWEMYDTGVARPEYPVLRFSAYARPTTVAGPELVSLIRLSLGFANPQRISMMCATNGGATSWSLDKRG